MLAPADLRIYWNERVTLLMWMWCYGFRSVEWLEKSGGWAIREKVNDRLLSTPEGDGTSSWWEILKETWEKSKSKSAVACFIRKLILRWKSAQEKSISCWLNSLHRKHSIRVWRKFWDLVIAPAMRPSLVVLLAKDYLRCHKIELRHLVNVRPVLVAV